VRWRFSFIGEENPDDHLYVKESFLKGVSFSSKVMAGDACARIKN